jgi:hypothetical protein
MRRAGRAVLVVGLVVIGSVGGGAVGRVARVFGQGAAPASAPTASEAEVQALTERAAKFWAARVSGDLETQWRLLEPRWQGRMTAAEYGSDLTGGRWLAYKIEGAAVNGIFAAVKVRLLVQQAAAPASAFQVRIRPQATVAEDAWIRIGGVWYRRLDPAERVPSQTTAQP